jgi:hypothetical protein
VDTCPLCLSLSAGRRSTLPEVPTETSIWHLMCIVLLPWLLPHHSSLPSTETTQIQVLATGWFCRGAVDPN